MSGFSDEQPNVDISTFDFSSLLPSAQDRSQLMANFAVLVTRVLAKYFPSFEQIPHLVRKHITHSYSQQMSQKSKVVSE